MHGNIISNSPLNNESPKVRELYPQYLRDTAKNVISFLEEYYDYLNREGFPSYELRHVIVENDIDETSEKYLNAIQGEIAKIIPNSAVIDRNTLYKRIVHYYRIKGTPESIDIFFKIFFDSLAELYYPNTALFKLSDGDFVKEIKYFLDANVAYSTDGTPELLAASGLSIKPLKQPKLGDDFVISLTALFNSDQLSDDAFVFTTTDFSPVAGEGGTFDLRRDTSGTYLAVQQNGMIGSNVQILRFSDDIFNDEWKNIRIEYSSNDDDITTTLVNATNISFSGTDYASLNATYTKTTSSLWETGTSDLTSVEVAGLIDYSITDLIDGQKYEITAAGDTNFVNLGAADNNVGTVFTYNDATSEDATTGKVKHRLPVWHIIDNGTIRYIDADVSTYHESGVTKGSNRLAVTSGEAIASIKWVNYSTLQSVQTANVKAYSNGNIVLNETIKHNRGYFNATENFSIFSKNTSVANTFDCRGRLAAFRIEGALSNNFDYRFTSLDAASNNALRDWSGSGNDGSIVIPPLPLDASSLILSLRSVDPNYTDSVVEVRRSSDDAEESFTAAEVADGTLLAWVNTDVDKLDLQAGSLDAFITNETATGFDFSVNNVGSNKFKNLLSAADTTAGTYTATLDVVLNSGSLTGCNLFHESSGSAVVTPLTEGANSISLTPDANTSLFFYILGTAVADVSITNITLTQTSADGTVSQWYDQSGNDNHATQGTDASQPKIVDAGVLVTRNGDAAIKSTSGNVMDFTLDSLSADGQQSVFAVLENDITSQDGYPQMFGITSTTSDTAHGSNGANRRPYWMTTPSGALYFTVDSHGGYSTNSRERHLYSHVMNDTAGGTSTVHQDGTQVDTRSITLDANQTFQSGKVLRVGTNATGALYMSEVIYYPSDQSAKRLAIEANIANAYGISGSFGAAADPSPYNWSWNNDQSSYGPLPTSLHPLPQTSSYADRGGFASSDKKIQDSEFWQDFSYQISTETSAELWKESYTRLVHPAGMKFFILLLIEIVGKSKWTEVISYLSKEDNPESWYTALVPPAKRLQDPSEGYHTPRYQPGWLNSAQRAIVIALAELQFNSEILDPYVNNFVTSAVNSSIASMKTFFNPSKEGFSSANNTNRETFSVCGFPLTRPVKNGEKIRVKFNYSTGNNASPVVTLLHTKNDVGSQLFDQIRFADDYDSGNIDNSLYSIIESPSSPVSFGIPTGNTTKVVSNGALKVSATENNPTGRYQSQVRYGNNSGNLLGITGLEDGKSYVLRGKCRVVDQGDLGTALARIDIADSEAQFETSNTTWTDFEVTTIIFPAAANVGVNAQYFDMGINSGPKVDNVPNSGLVSAEFKDVELIENPKQFAVVRKFESGRANEVGNITSTKGHQLQTNKTREVIDITLESEDDNNMFIAFIDGTDTTGRSFSVDGFEIIDVDRNDYPLTDGGDSLSIISVASARYNRKQNFDRVIDLDSTLELQSIPFRDSYVYNDYINGEAGAHNPRFWLDERSLSGTGWPGFAIEVFSLSYVEGITRDLTQANISNPHEAYVKVVKLPVVITSSTTAEATVNAAFTYQITTDSLEPFTVTDIQNKPTWLTINASTGLMSGTPPAGTTLETINDFKFTVTSFDGVASLLFTLTLTIVGNQVNITDPGTLSGTLGAAFTTTLSADQTVATNGWSIDPSTFSEKLPGGLTLDANTGVISGIPYENYEGLSYYSPPYFSTRIKVVSADGASDVQELIFNLALPSPTPIVNTQTSFQLTKDVAFTHTIGTTNENATVRTGGPAPVTGEEADSFTIRSGTLPPGLSLNRATGVISGTPTAAGLYGDDNDGTNPGSATQIKIDYKWLGVQSLTATNPNDVANYNFAVDDQVVVFKNIQSPGTFAINLQSTDTTSTTIYWGDDTSTNLISGQLAEHTY